MGRETPEKLEITHQQTDERKGRYLRGGLQLYWGWFERGALQLLLSWPALEPAQPLAWPAAQHGAQLYFCQRELSLQQTPADCRVQVVLWWGLLRQDGRAKSRGKQYQSPSEDMKLLLFLNVSTERFPSLQAQPCFEKKRFISPR